MLTSLADISLTVYQYWSILYHMNGKQIIKILESHDWIVLRTSGSHVRMGKADKRTTVPVHGKRDLGKGLVAAIERQTGVKIK